MDSEAIGPSSSLQRLSAVSAKVAAVVAEAVAQWTPEPPPPTVVMGSIGRLLVERSAEFTDGELAAIFAAVEDVLTSGVRSEGDEVATGLLEAALNVGDRLPEQLARVMAFAGPEARAYCEAWDEFCGVASKWNPRKDC